jgi:GrpB-like predicted nucleotidyltransferase (UPF0157 family)
LEFLFNERREDHWDHLRQHPEAATAYTTLKKDLAQRYQAERDRYTAEKTEFIRTILAGAGASLIADST